MLIHSPAKAAGVSASVVAIAAMLNLSGCSPRLDSAEPASNAPDPSTPSLKNSTSSLKNEADPPETSAVASTPAASQPPDSANLQTSQAQQASSSADEFNVQPPASEIVPAQAKAAATTLLDPPLPLQVQPYSVDELFAAGGGGCGMSLWRAEGSFEDDSVLFSGLGEGAQLLIKLNGEFMPFERIEGNGETFYGQFAQQRFRNLAGDIEVTTEVELGAKGEIESVEIERGQVVLTQKGVSQEIAVKGDAGC